MTGAELKAERERLALTQSEAADIVRVDARTWRRWEADDVAPPGLLDDFLEALRAGHLPARITGAWREYLLRGTES